MKKHDKIMSIATQRGFLYPSCEIYTPKAGFWTYGHLGTRVKQRWENLWRSSFLSLDPNFFEIDDCNVMPEKVFQSSGHLEHFNDPLTECKKCHARFMADDLVGEKLKKKASGLSEGDLTKLIKDNNLKCDACGGELMDVKFFNMMFDVKVGVTGEEVMYLRPESAQSPYLAFKREYEALRKKLPLGLAVVGKAFRNEISPRQGFFRLREFTQAELQIFFDPELIEEHEDFSSLENYKLILFSDKKQEVSCKEANEKWKLPKFYVYHMAKVQQFYLDTLQIPREKFRLRELDEKERAFYNKIHFDVELDMETLGGFKEVGGVHYRTDYDLLRHQNGSSEKMEHVSPDGKRRFVPHVLELSFGVDRNVWALIDLFFKEEKERTLFTFPSNLAPIDVAVFPLMNKDKVPKLSKNIFKELYKNFKVFYDSSGSIGRRYRRQDEVGTKVGITVDFDSLKDQSVTLRDRDSMEQIRVKIADLNIILNGVLNDGKKLEDFGKVI